MPVSYLTSSFLHILYQNNHTVVGFVFSTKDLALLLGDLWGIATIIITEAHIAFFGILWISSTQINQTLQKMMHSD